MQPIRPDRSRGRAIRYGMPGPTYPVTLDTTGKLIDHEMMAFMYCPSCSRSADIDLEKLAERVGRDWYFIARPWPVKCADCGNGDVEVRISRRVRNPKVG
jgi:hypothetical protein